MINPLAFVSWGTARQRIGPINMRMAARIMPVTEMYPRTSIKPDPNAQNNDKIRFADEDYHWFVTG